MKKKEKGDKKWLFSAYEVWLYPLNFVPMRQTIFFIINLFYLNMHQWVSTTYNQMIPDKVISVVLKFYENIQITVFYSLKRWDSSPLNQYMINGLNVGQRN